jgi:hypothetical protein
VIVRSSSLPLEGGAPEHLVDLGTGSTRLPVHAAIGSSRRNHLRQRSFAVPPRTVSVAEVLKAGSQMKEVTADIRTARETDEFPTTPRLVCGGFASNA